VKPKTKPAAALAIEPSAKARAAASPSRQVWLFAGIGAAVAVLFVVGAFVAYQLGKGTRGENPGTNPPTNPDAAKTAPDAGPNVPVPGPADVILTPAKAAEHEGEEQTVEFRVAKIVGASVLDLSSPDGFTVHIKVPADRATVLAFELKVIRVRGKIQRDPNAGLYIDVTSLKQIVPVGR
jgi:hypothetical protein